MAGASLLGKSLSFPALTLSYHGAALEAFRHLGGLPKVPDNCPNHPEDGEHGFQLKSCFSLEICAHLGCASPSERRLRATSVVQFNTLVFVFVGISHCRGDFQFCAAVWWEEKHKFWEGKKFQENLRSFIWFESLQSFVWQSEVAKAGVKELSGCLGLTPPWSQLA